ncbi:Deoxyribodipyrimidine photo-lyase [Maioricimonas rarisocia]|uniref:Deoxyribodipyrimidine photo-lyase n=1 Tax=Maioricimonas rarisocia TaxID=2528026 RepID=A0A517Z8X9_9PLAN|nr:deoxyribodipyrimidine photo-lyase [Maioricimonas rarisocia]QDU38934.1 Deoxyribodipyrimidine photo-lyase [Maioricimonas rarisocia]
MAEATSIVWLRRDLRLADNPALEFAASHADTVIPLFIWDLDEEGGWSPGEASRWWLHHSLTALDDSLAERGSKLVIRSGNPHEIIADLVDSTGAALVTWNRRYEPAAIEQDRRIKEALKSAGCEVRSFNGSLLREPWEIETGQGEPYKVFTPFWKSLRANLGDVEPYAAPDTVPAPESWPDSMQVDDLNLLPAINWDADFHDAWTPGEAGAQQRLDEFLASRMANYDEMRDRPDRAGTSELSAHLHFGEITPRQIYAEVNHSNLNGRTRKSADVFLSEVGWREFAHHLLYHFPETTDQPLREQFERFPWGNSESALQAWQKGQTGYPIVDAGMRQLWAIGWMHNRVRMIVGSFLTKDLLQPWQQGSKWFWDTLVDADLANNTLGWQWVAGCGADASPFFRVFNPVLQGEKFDPDGEYVRRWVPELADLPNKWIHKPWAASDQVLADAGVTLGETYPEPIVDHSEARKAALAAYNEFKGG